MTNEELGMEFTQDELAGLPPQDGLRITAKERKRRRLYMVAYRRKLNNPLDKLKTKWRSAFAGLSEAEQTRLTKQQTECCFLVKSMIVASGGQPEFSGFIYRDVREYLNHTLLTGNSISDDLFAQLPAEDRGRFDQSYKEYGLRLRIPSSVYWQFLESILISSDPEFDLAILEEITNLLRGHIDNIGKTGRIGWHPVGKIILSRTHTTEEIARPIETKMMTLNDEARQINREIARSVGCLHD